jgi:hypothetical protein
MIKMIKRFHEKGRSSVELADHVIIFIMWLTTITTLLLIFKISFSAYVILLSLVFSILIDIPLDHKFGFDPYDRLSMLYASALVSIIIILVFL